MADTSTLIPFGGEDNTALSAGLGGLVSSWFGSWWSNGFNGNGFNRGYDGGVAPVATAAADTVILDGLSNISSQLSGVNTHSKVFAMVSTVLLM